MKQGQPFGLKANLNSAQLLSQLNLRNYMKHRAAASAQIVRTLANDLWRYLRFPLTSESLQCLARQCACNKYEGLLFCFQRIKALAETLQCT